MRCARSIQEGDHSIINRAFGIRAAGGAYASCTLRVPEMDKLQISRQDFEQLLACFDDVMKADDLAKRLGSAIESEERAKAEQWSLSELKTACKDIGAHCGGTKAELIERYIEQFMFQQASAALILFPTQPLADSYCLHFLPPAPAPSLSHSTTTHAER